mgnify:CR=1 FL=1
MNPFQQKLRCMFMWNLTAYYQEKSTESLLNMRQRFSKSPTNAVLAGIGIGFTLLFWVLYYLGKADFTVGFTLWGGFVALLCVPMDNQIRINKINEVLRDRGYQD